MNKQELKERLSTRAGEYDYSYERFSNGDSEYLVYPYERGCEIQGAPMRYRFTSEGEGN